MKRILIFLILLILSCNKEKEGLFHPYYEKEIISTPEKVSRIKFLNDEEGWILCNEKVYWTNNGGSDWHIFQPFNDTSISIVGIDINTKTGLFYCWDNDKNIYLYQNSLWGKTYRCNKDCILKFYNNDEGWCIVNCDMLLHFKNNEWDTIAVFPPQYRYLYYIEPVREDEVWISNSEGYGVGDTCIQIPVAIHYKNGIIDIDTIPCDTIGLFYSRFLWEIAFATPDEGWGVGMRGNYPYPGHIYRYINGKWEPYLFIHYTGIGIQFLIENNGWIYIGEGNILDLLHWNGSEWTIHEIDKPLYTSSIFFTEKWCWIGRPDTNIIIKINVENWR